MLVKNYTFEAEPVLMDFHLFRDCTFRRCRLIYCGYSMVQVEHCRFEDCRWEFGGPAAATLQFLNNLHLHGGELGQAIVQQARSIIEHPAEPNPPSSPPPPSTSPQAARSPSAPDPRKPFEPFKLPRRPESRSGQS
ncbi:MAG: hypothetical protein FJ387_06155 [Verrucomicrobia bacterium]|nr:hypothetical protein [Verrucomicrobiota bacterium]